MQVYSLQAPGRASRPQSAGSCSITPTLPSFVAQPTGTRTPLTTTPSVTQFFAPVKLKYSTSKAISKVDSSLVQTEDTDTENFLHYFRPLYMLNMRENTVCEATSL